MSGKGAVDNSGAQQLLEVPRQFLQDGIQFLNRCTKPDLKEFIQISRVVAMGFLIMGFLGYFVKLIHIPINNIIVYSIFTGGSLVAPRQ